MAKKKRIKIRMESAIANAKRGKWTVNGESAEGGVKSKISGNGQARPPM